MSKIKIKNFGPIKEGYLENDGWLEVKKATMFIGNQGSGKSIMRPKNWTVTRIKIR
jgi:predicted ATPase